jgi:hypothetical protein
MKSDLILDDRLEQLAQELLGRGSRSQSIMNEVMNCKPETAKQGVEVLDAVKQRNSGRLIFIAVAASAVLALGLLGLQPQSLYAQSAKALKKVKTIHLKGSTSEIVRNWPAEDESKVEKRETYEMDAWYWKSPTGANRSYERIGPVIQTRDDRMFVEYQSDMDLLYRSDRNTKDSMGRISSIADTISSLEKEAIKVESLGLKEKQDKRLTGFRLKRRGAVEEYWIDSETKLPILCSRKSMKDNSTIQEFELSYDQPIPDAIVAYSPPSTKHIRMDSKDESEFALHVQKLQGMVQANPLDTVIIPRKSPNTFSLQYTMTTPNGKHSVVPLDCGPNMRMNIEHFLRLRVHPNPNSYEWRVPAELADLEFPRSDLICPKDADWKEWVTVALTSLQLEFHDVQEERVFWIAKHDGRKMRPWKEVNPPIVGDTRKTGVLPGVGFKNNPATMPELFREFNSLQNSDLNGSHPIIDDQTGLPTPPQWNRSEYATWIEFSKAVNFEQYYVASDTPWFAGKGSTEIAKKWFQEQLGITFKEEMRPTTVHVIRRKSK